MICSEPLSLTAVATCIAMLSRPNFAHRASSVKTGHCEGGGESIV